MSLFKFAPYSFSRINVYQTCPRKFKYNYVDKVKVPFVYSEALIKGGCVHSILEHFNPKDPTAKSTHKHFNKYWPIAERYLKTDAGWNLISQPSIREYDLGLTHDMKPCPYGSKEAMFRGSVDHIIVKDDIIYLTDHKTGKYKDQKCQQYDQLLFYAIWFFVVYKHIDKIMITYNYLEHDMVNDLLLERKYFDKYVMELTSSILNIEKDTIFKKSYKLCDWCDYKNHCDKDNS